MASYGTSTPVVPKTWQQKYFEIGVGRTGLSEPAMIYEPWHGLTTGRSWAEGNAASGDVTADGGTSYNGGSVKLSTGATASSRARIALGLTSGLTVSSWLKLHTTEKFYCVTKFTVTTTPDAQTLIWLPYMLSGNQTVVVGVLGSTSTTKFAMQAGTTTPVASTVDIDTGTHTIELWGRGTTTMYFSVDNEPPISSVHAGAVAGPSCPIYEATNGTTEADQSVYVHESLFLAPNT